MLFQQIEQNKRKTVWLIFLFCLIVAGAGAAIGYLAFDELLYGIMLAVIILAVYIPVTYLSASKQVLAISGAVLASPTTHAQLYRIVEGLCIPARLPMPKIYIIPDPSPNAFATGTSPEKGAVAFTTGLLERLNREEIEAVAAHELAHIRNYDIRLLTITIALIAVIALLADIGFRMMFYGRRGGGKQKSHPALLIIALAFIILSPLAARFVYFAVSRNREYLADATAVEMTRNSVGLQNALRKISSSDLDVIKANKSTAAMYISSPFQKERKKRTNWFSTHPSMESRIERLSRM